MIEAFITAARRALPHEPLDVYKVRVIGRTPDKVAEILGLITRGEKTGTFSLAAEFEARPHDAPTAGDACVLTQADGTPAVIVRVIEVERVAFGDITPRHLDLESPRLQDLRAWRKVHQAYWAPTLRALDRELSHDTEVLCQKFRVVWPTAGGV